jgi:hypothetical protein
MRFGVKKSGGASLSSPQVGAIVCYQFALVRIFFDDLGAPGLSWDWPVRLTVVLSKVAVIGVQRTTRPMLSGQGPES